MRSCFVALMLILVPLAGAVAAQSPDFSAVDEAIEAAIERGEIPGAVVLIGRGDQVLHRKAFGHRAVEPEAEAMTPDTIFDLASISKCVGMATSVMKLVDEGKIALDDPVAKHIPAFGASGKQEVTIEQLLLHRGGLAAGNPMSEYADGPEKALERIYAIGIPIVHTSGFPDPLEAIDIVTGPDHEAGAAVAKFLVDLGHREIAYVHPDTRRETKAARYLNWRINRRVNKEDTALIARVQAGMGSSSYSVGPLSESEVCLRSFTRRMHEMIPESRSARKV